MSTPKQIKRKTLLSVTIILILSWVSGYIFLSHEFNDSVDERFNTISNSTEKLFDIKVKEESRVLKFKLERIVSADGLAKAVANNDYKKIDSIVSPYYTNLKALNSDIQILTFRSSEGITLYRAHKKEFYGDTLNKKRKLIVDTNSMEKSFSGFEVGKLEMTYRVTQAIFYENRYVGNVELGVSPRFFIKNLNTIFKIDIGIAIDKSLSSVMLNQDSISIDEKYTLIRGCERLKQYFRDSKELADFRVSMEIPLQNHLSKALGFLVVGFDISGIIEKNKDFMYKLFVMGVFVTFILVVVFHKGFNLILNRFERQAYTDHLTGLQNRQALNDELYSGKSNVLILSNIKEFSLLNELYGVDIGNEVLKQVGDAFKSFASEYALSVYRTSSDEYVLLKQESSFEADKYDEILEKLHTKINSLAIYIDKIDETLGVEIYSGISFDYFHSLEYAQMALKKAREKSLPYLEYTEKLDTKKSSEHILGMKRVIRHAIEHKNVIPFFQPITDRDGKIIKYEALVRIVDFEHGEKKIIFPDEFLPIAIKSGLYIDIAIEMLSHSFNFFAGRDEKFSVNFLPNDFFNVSLMEAFMALISKFDSPQKVIVEITEQEGVEDFDRLLTIVQKLRKLGVQIAIDDFGSGYSNYTHILTLKPDYLKIDGSLIKNILIDEDSRILVSNIISFAKDLNIKTIAEYVENKEIFELLKEFGVDEYQGYYFGRPTDLINT